MTGPEPIRVLLADDDSVDRRSVRRSLMNDKRHYAIDEAGSKAEAEKRLSTGQNYDIVLMDYDLRDGFSLELKPYLVDTPFLVITGAGNERVAADALRAGAAGYLIKDPDLEYLRILLPLVDNALHKHKVEKQLAQRTEELNAHAMELERSNSELENFAYVASHDLRTPLRNIFSLAEWIEEDGGEELPQVCREHVKDLLQQTFRMDQLLTDLLDYSRVGRMESGAEATSVEDVVEELVCLLRPRPGFRVETKGEFPVLYTPRTAIRRVLQNLIDNALKHHDREEGLVEISCTAQGEFVEFSVRDDGPGIEPRYHELVFKIFQRLHVADSLNGTGMGLAIVRKTVESFGGTVTVDSNGERGTCFRFSWRVSDRPTQVGASQEQS